MPGRLTVTGFVREKAVAEDMLTTAGKPARLKVWIDDLGVPPQANDLVFVRAAIVDANGVVCPDADETIRFNATGAATFAGENKSAAEMGVASILVRTASVKGLFKIEATTSGGIKGFIQG